MGKVRVFTGLQTILYRHTAYPAYIYKKKYCIYPDKSKCSGNITRSHTIQRGGSLNKIALDGHVYQFKWDLSTLIKTNGRPIAHKIGIKEATTFTGFCGFHDNEIFRPIETAPFTSTEEQCFLLAYRAVAKEVYMKKAQKESLPINREFEKGVNPEFQRFIHDLNTNWKIGVEKGLIDLESHWQEFNEKIISKNYSDIRYLTIYINDVPDIMFSGCFPPEYDFHGNHIQKWGDLSLDLNLITFTSFATGEGGIIVFSWLKSSNPVCSNFIKSLLSLSEKEIPNAVVRLSIEYSENVVFDISWWDQLNSKVQEDIIARFVPPPVKIRRNDCLINDGNNYVKWKINKIIENI